VRGDPDLLRPSSDAQHKEVTRVAFSHRLKPRSLKAQFRPPQASSNRTRRAATSTSVNRTATTSPSGGSGPSMRPPAQLQPPPVAGSTSCSGTGRRAAPRRAALARAAGLDEQDEGLGRPPATSYASASS